MGAEYQLANGGLDDPKRASEIIAIGEADVITLGKGALANSDWVNKVKSFLKKKK